MLYVDDVCVARNIGQMFKLSRHGKHPEEGRCVCIY